MIKHLRFRWVFICIAVLFSSGFTWAQTVSGVVTSEDGKGLPGATVLIKNSARGTVTDIDGNYTLELREGDEIIVFSFVGYVSEEVIVSNRATINVALTPDLEVLAEVVVVGYGTQEVRTLTSAVATLGSEEISKTPTGNAVQALQGRLPGVQITSAGAPGAQPNIRVRGLGSFPGADDSQPLFVVDGMFVDNIDFLNTSDIADITVLKDASSSSIYGVRGANGVVIIETKSGAYNKKTEIVYDGYYGVQVPQDVLQMANTEQFANYINATGEGSEIALIQNAIGRFGRSRVNPNLPVTNTDWFDEVMVGGAPIQNHSISINGGTNNARYSVGASYFE
ncbi:MAG: carboxypeptidase-like regulatory domain-containing protein, partial [Bacteroidota bacterium]